MKASQTEVVRNLSIVGHDDNGPARAGERWVPSPKARRPAAPSKAASLKADGFGLKAACGLGDPGGQVIPLGKPAMLQNGPQAVPCSFDDVRLGFAAPDDRLTSLNIPAEAAFRQKDLSLSFDIEFDPEQPDRMTISLLEADEDRFIHTVRQSIPFPARLLAELLGRRMATAEEASAWRALDGEEQDR